MIDELTLKNFKCFGELDLKFTAVNVLAGLNGMGKSTVIQSIYCWGSRKKVCCRNRYCRIKTDV